MLNIFSTVSEEMVSLPDVEECWDPAEVIGGVNGRDSWVGVA